MTYIFSLTGEVPAKKNSRIVLKSGKNIPSENYRKWHGYALASLFCALSSILDTLTDAGIIKDDNWQIVQNIILENDYKEKESGVKITIVEL